MREVSSKTELQVVKCAADLRVAADLRMDSLESMPAAAEPGAEDGGETSMTLHLLPEELLVKVFSYGFVIGEGTYLRSGWNILDFIIGACSLKRHPLRAAPALRSARRNRR